MIIVDSELERREKNGIPIRVAMVGAGYMGQGIALQIEQYMTYLTNTLKAAYFTGPLFLLTIVNNTG